MLSQPERDQIVQYFFGLSLFQKSNINYFSFDLPEWPALFVKYGDRDLMAEATTQHFFHTLAQKDRSAPGIPAVYSAFRENGHGENKPADPGGLQLYSRRRLRCTASRFCRPVASRPDACDS